MRPMDPDGSTLIMPERPAPGSALRAQASATGRKLADRYLLGGAVGRGGMSTVYLARDELLDRDVAVKILLPALAEGAPAHVARFEREARAVAALQHPAVVKVYDTGQERETHFIVMEYVAGQGLDRILAGGHRLDPEEATRIAGLVAGALAAAHAAGILHRDVKPSNVMLTPDGGVKVLDFGIARAQQDPTLTEPAFAIGTAAYMSPERVLGRAGDERSDIYSLGCLLYALLTGRPPFVAESTLSVLHQQVHTAPIPPTSLGARIPPPLQAMVMGMLAKEPAARPQTASEVAGRLAAPRSARPVAAAPVRSRRRPWPLAALLLVGLVALVVALALAGTGPPSPRAADRPANRHAVPRNVTSHPAAAATHAAPPPPTTPAPHKTPPPKHVPPGHGGVPPGHEPGGPPGHRGKPPKPPKPPK